VLYSESPVTGTRKSGTLKRIGLSILNGTSKKNKAFVGDGDSWPECNIAIRGSTIQLFKSAFKNPFSKKRLITSIEIDPNATSVQAVEYPDKLIQLTSHQQNVNFLFKLPQDSSTEEFLKAYKESVELVNKKREIASHFASKTSSSVDMYDAWFEEGLISQEEHADLVERYLRNNNVDTSRYKVRCLDCNRAYYLIPGAQEISCEDCGNKVGL